MSRPPAQPTTAPIVHVDAHHVQRERVKQSLLYVRRKDGQDSRTRPVF